MTQQDRENENLLANPESDSYQGDAKSASYQQMSTLRSASAVISSPPLESLSSAHQPGQSYSNLISGLYEMATRSQSFWNFNIYRTLSTLSPKKLGLSASFFSGLAIIMTNNLGKGEGMAVREIRDIIFINALMWAGILLVNHRRNNQRGADLSEAEVEDEAFLLQIELLGYEHI